jgi:iron complex outermembrane receptor protein
LLQARFGWKHSFKKLSLEIFAAGDNLLDNLYSLGNDLNAPGNRYYNPAAARNASAGIILSSN